MTYKGYLIQYSSTMLPVGWYVYNMDNSVVQPVNSIEHGEEIIDYLTNTQIYNSGPEPLDPEYLDNL
jgi:hypothetical protein